MSNNLFLMFSVTYNYTYNWIKVSVFFMNSFQSSVTFDIHSFERQIYRPNIRTVVTHSLSSRTLILDHHRLRYGICINVYFVITGRAGGGEENTSGQIARVRSSSPICTRVTVQPINPRVSHWSIIVLQPAGDIHIWGWYIIDRERGPVRHK